MRQNTNGDLQDSAPCQDCHNIMLSLQLKKIVYSAPNNTFLTCKPQEYKTEHTSQGNKFFKSKIQNPKSKIQNPKSKITNNLHIHY